MVTIWSFLCVILYIGFASAQKVIQLTYCSVNEENLRMDCKYSLPTESSEAFCKYTQGTRLLDTTDPDEEQHAPFKNRAKVRIFPGNICRLLFKGLPAGKSNFTCNIKQSDSATVNKTSIVDKSKLLMLTIIAHSHCLSLPYTLLCCFTCTMTVVQLCFSFQTLIIIFLLQSSFSPAQRGVSYYKAAVAYCWPWWHFPCCWKFTSCEQGTKLLHTLTMHP